MHTPGPWRVDPNHLNDVQTNDGLEIGATFNPNAAGHTWEIAGTMAARTILESLANARLIAAAPDLLEALIALRGAFMSHTQWSGDPPTEVVAADAAIRKATI